MRACLLGFLLISVAPLLGCDSTGRRLATNLDRFAGYIGTATTIVDRQATSGAISPTTAKALASDLLQLNRINGDLIEAVKPYKSADGSRLELTGDGRKRLDSLLSASRKVVVSRLSDPEFLNLADDQRRDLTAIYTQIETLIQISAEIISTVQEVKK